MYYNTHNTIYIILEYKSYNNIQNILGSHNTHNTIYIIFYKIQNISVGSLITCITIHTTQHT